ncbi:MAG: YcxB family protein [Sedimentisphaerales bacterium]|jgi:hypothetical protein|nr:YcxB family protein [Sedimentisphaerales bacterium]HNY77606.1 YcxB family protein [Sedimentisphaerales bacterium]HOC61939.1 YcxB family protein [Sedimentisphaerales bacterium]HOH63781.1 YcxB family protein [Sedimentisphaerales bacterium]HPY48315.1 YcxB family protein [Sedimentisphaerales bacterium]
MNQEITASYVWTVDDLLKAHESHRRVIFRPPFRIGLAFLSVMAILAGWCAYDSDGWSIPAVALPAVGVYFLLLRRYDVRWTLRRQYSKRKDQGLEVVWKLDTEGFRITTSESDMRQNWSLVDKVRKSRHGFLLYCGGMFYWLPMTAFANDDSRRQAADLLSTMAEDYAEIR